MQLDAKVVGGRVVTPDGTLRIGIGIQDGRIAMLAPDDLLPHAKETIGANGRVVIPGVVDPESHPGHTEPWTLDAQTETKAAAATGITTWGIQSPSSRFGQASYRFDGDPSQSVSFHEVFEHGRDTFEANSTIDFFFTFQLEGDLQANEIPEYARRYGVTSYKFYGQWKKPELDHFGVAAANGLVLGWDDGTFLTALEKIVEVGSPAIVSFHPENWEISRMYEERLRRAGRTDMAAWDERSPGFVEAHHLRTLTYLAKVTGAPVYAQHCTNAKTLDEVRRARDLGVELYVQSGPSWLYLHRDEAKIMPPLRGTADSEALWAALRAGEIDALGSDHVVARLTRAQLSPESQDVWTTKGTAYGSRAEMHLPIMLHEGVNKGRLSIERVVKVLCENPARIFGVYPKKGVIAVGSDADLVLVDLDREMEVTDEMMLTRPGWTLLRGRVMKGFPVLTMLRGRVIARWAEGAARPEVFGAPTGRYLPRTLGGPKARRTSPEFASGVS